MSREVDVNGVQMPATDGLPTVPVRATLWGETEADVHQAEANAKQGRWRAGWRFVKPVVHIGGACPFSVRDPSPLALAVDAGYGWAYEVRPYREDC